MEVAVFSFGEASCLVVVQTFTSSTQVQSTEPVIVTESASSSICASFLERYGSTVPFHGRQCTMSSHNSCRTALEQTLGISYLTTVTIRELRLALQDEWAAMPQQLIDTSFSAWADAVKPA
ncbi:hypothetical protein TNCV_858361 [Trichonephila clavipes]|nr:hypothetical protein TNCV_858361 [Trichonephila clavipes]